MPDSKTRRGGLAAISLALVASGALMSAPTHAVDGSDQALNMAVALGYVPTFGAALANAGLVGELNAGGPFTVFVPHEAAFAKLPAGTLDRLLRPENRAELQALLRHHIVPGKVTAADLAGTLRLQTLAGDYLEVSGGGTTINGAQITMADELTSNGVFHVIDAVILPAG
jgi:uncharacterized surface protein with fasciclin (FAS1) repeats